MQNQFFQRQSDLPVDEYRQGAAYVAKLELWARRIRFKPNSDEKREFEHVLRSLQRRFHQPQSPSAQSLPASDVRPSIDLPHLISDSCLAHMRGAC